MTDETCKYFTAMHYEPHDDCEAYGRHLHPDDWRAYWNSLSPNEQQSLRDKAQWEHMTLSAVAEEWGAHSS